MSEDVHSLENSWVLNIGNPVRKDICDICEKNNYYPASAKYLNIILLCNRWIEKFYDDIFILVINHQNKKHYMDLMFGSIGCDKNNLKNRLDIFMDNYDDIDTYDKLWKFDHQTHIIIVEKLLQENINPPSWIISSAITNNNIEFIDLLGKYNVDINIPTKNKKMLQSLENLGITQETLLEYLLAVFE
jgi:hypothetical protein